MQEILAKSHIYSKATLTRLLAVGLYLAVFINSAEGIVTATWRWAGWAWWLSVLSQLATVVISFLITDFLFRQWQTARRKRLLVAIGILIIVAVAGFFADLVNLYVVKLELSKAYP